MRTSETINEIATALAKAQGAFTAAKKQTAGIVGNQTRMYADLASVVESVRKPLSENGLAYVQTAATGNGCVAVTTRLLHTSGQWIEGTLELPSGGTPQTIGSATTYARRYSLMAILGVAPDDDDDGKAASEATAGQQAPARARRQSAPAEPQEPRELTPGEVLMHRVRDSSPDVRSSVGRLSTEKKKALSAKALNEDEQWASDLRVLLDALAEPAAA